MYLDPGFGSMVIQLVVAGIAAAGAFLFMARSRIKEFFRKRKEKGNGEAGDEAGDEPKSAADDETHAGE